MKKNLLLNRAFCLCFVFTFLCIFTVFGQSITVNTTSDENNGNTANIASLIGSPGGSGISLREAIIATNNEPNGTSVTITVPSGTYNLSLFTAGETSSLYNAASGDLDIVAATVSGTNKTVTINGAGSASTIINQTAVGERIIEVHSGSAANFPGSIAFSLNGVRCTGGNPTSSSGAAILSGRPGDVTNITNCLFNNNVSNNNGGVISQSSGNASHNLTITNCTFSSNTAGLNGGVISYSGSGGTILIDQNIFTNNTATGSGGAIYITGTSPGSAVCNITRNTFSGNAANSVSDGGGAIAYFNVATININYNRFINNSAPNVPTAKVISFNSGGTNSSNNSDNNWWGVNSGPALGSILGTAAAKWLQLRSTASPNPVCANAANTVASGFLFNSNNELITSSNLLAEVGLAISFVNAVGGTLSGAQSTIQSNGTATVTYTAGSSAGTGSVNAQVDNVSGSDATAKASFTISSPPTPGITGTPTGCGSVTLTATGGTSYVWSGGNNPNSATNTFTSSNTYLVTVTNAAGCSASTSQAVTVSAAPSTPTITLGSSTTFCTGGSVVLSSSAASGNQWFLNNGIINGETNQSITVSASGTYTVVVTSNGCSSSPSAGTVVTVNSPTLSDTTASVCNSFTWQGITYYHTGDKTFTTTNAAGCDSVRTLHLTILFVPNTFNKTDAVCYGSATGTISISPTGGTGPYTYRIGTVGPINAASGSFSNLKAGTYRAYVQDATGCIGVAAPIVVAQQPQVIATVSPSNASCNGAADGRITISNPVGNGPFMYKTGLSGSLSPLSLPNTTITGLKAGDYRIYIQDATGCTGPANVASVQQPADVVVNYTITPITCANPKGAITLSLPGNATGTFKLNPGGNYTSQNVYNNLVAGTYYGYAKDAGGCTGRSVPIVLTPATGCVPFARVASTTTEGRMQLLVYPNPAIGNFTLQLNNYKPGKAEMVMTNESGVTVEKRSIVLSASQNNTQFSMDNKAVGTYFIKVITADGVQMSKVEKMKN